MSRSVSLRGFEALIAASFAAQRPARCWVTFDKRCWSDMSKFGKKWWNNCCSRSVNNRSRKGGKVVVPGPRLFERVTASRILLMLTMSVPTRRAKGNGRGGMAVGGMVEYGVGDTTRDKATLEANAKLP